MKLPRLFTPEQFRNHLKEKMQVASDSNNMVKAECWDLMDKYFDKIKGSLKKEMFVNEINKPKHSDYDISTELVYYQKFEAWQEAEKKVIFIPKKHIELDGDGVWFSGYFRGFGIWLHDLAEATNGELELQNIEL